MAFSTVWKMATDGDFYRKMGDWFVDNVPHYDKFANLIGYSQMRNAERSATTQIDYNNYLSAGNQRALQDWYKNVGQHGRTIKYPELSYAGAIYKAATGSARSMFDASIASANYYGNLPYRVWGLYNVGSGLSRFM